MLETFAEDPSIQHLIPWATHSQFERERRFVLIPFSKTLADPCTKRRPVNAPAKSIPADEFDIILNPKNNQSQRDARTHIGRTGPVKQFQTLCHAGQDRVRASRICTRSKHLANATVRDWTD